MTPRARKVLPAGSEARSLSHAMLAQNISFLGCFARRKALRHVLRNLNVDAERARIEVMRQLDPNFDEPEESAGAQPRTSGKPSESKTPALNAFGRNLTELARKGALDPVIGRTAETKRVIQILCRRPKTTRC